MLCDVPALTHLLSELAVLPEAIEERSGANSPQGMQPDLECPRLEMYVARHGSCLAIKARQLVGQREGPAEKKRVPRIVC